MLPMTFTFLSIPNMLILAPFGLAALFAASEQEWTPIRPAVQSTGQRNADAPDRDFKSLQSHAFSSKSCWASIITLNKGGDFPYNYPRFDKSLGQ